MSIIRNINKLADKESKVGKPKNGEPIGYLEDGEAVYPGDELLQDDVLLLECGNW